MVSYWSSLINSRMDLGWSMEQVAGLEYPPFSDNMRRLDTAIRVGVREFASHRFAALHFGVKFLIFLCN